MSACFLTGLLSSPLVRCFQLVADSQVAPSEPGMRSGCRGRWKKHQLLEQKNLEGRAAGVKGCSVEGP